MKLKGDLGYNWFGPGVADTCVFNDGVNQSTLSKFIEAITMFLDADSHINTIIHIDHENNATREEDTIINQQRSITQ
jgi:hypothetical protein